MTHHTLGRRVANQLLHNVLIVAALVCVVVIGTATETTVMAERPAVTDSPAALLVAHDCWTGEAPADVEIPGHVVVSVRGEARHAGEQMVGKAFAQIFDGVDHDLTVHGFCR